MFKAQDKLYHYYYYCYYYDYDYDYYYYDDYYCHCRDHSKFHHHHHRKYYRYRYDYFMETVKPSNPASGTSSVKPITRPWGIWSHRVGAYIRRL